MTRISPDGYWPRGMDEGAKSVAMSDFERRIYPICRGIEERDMAAERAMSASEMTDDSILSECITIHRQDLAIYNSGIKPNRISNDQELMANLRRKAARAAGV